MHGYGPTELAAAFRTVRRNTIQTAQDIPDDKYDYIAAPGCQSVAQLLAHIAVAPMIQLDMHRDQKITTLKGFDFPALIGRITAEGQKPRNKAELIDLLTGEGESLAKWIESLSPEFLAETFSDQTGESHRTRFESLLSIKEHEMHHRGQLMLVQRMLGVVPHLTRQRMERMGQRVPAQS